MGSCNNTNKSSHRTKTGPKNQEDPTGKPGQLNISKTVGLTKEYCKSTIKLQRDETKPIYMDGPSLSVRELNQLLFSNEKSPKGKLVLRSLFTRDFQKGRSEKKNVKEKQMRDNTTNNDDNKSKMDTVTRFTAHEQNGLKILNKRMTNPAVRTMRGVKKPTRKNCKQHKVYVPILKNELVAEEITCQRKSVKLTMKVEVRSDNVLFAHDTKPLMLRLLKSQSPLASGVVLDRRHRVMETIRHLQLQFLTISTGLKTQVQFELAHQHVCKFADNALVQDCHAG